MSDNFYGDGNRYKGFGDEPKTLAVRWRTGYCSECRHNPVIPIPDAARDKSSPCFGCWFTEDKKNWENRQVKKMGYMAAQMDRQIEGSLSENEILREENERLRLALEDAKLFANDEVKRWRRTGTEMVADGGLRRPGN